MSLIDTDRYRDTGPLMLAPHETNTVVPEKQLEGPREDPYPQVTRSSPEMVATGRKCSSTSTTTPTQTCLQSSTDASKEGWGAHLGEHTARRTKNWSFPSSRKVSTKVSPLSLSPHR